MATRTGDPSLDELIEGMVLRAAADPLIRRFQQGSPGNCHDATEHFLWSFIRPSGILKKGYVFRRISLVEDGSEALWREGGYSWEGYGGYEDREKGDPSHTFFEVTTPEGEVFTIDFAATQYGYIDWPLVQRRSLDGSWQRDPDGVEWKGDATRPSVDRDFGSLAADLQRRLPERRAVDPSHTLDGSL